MVGYIPAAVGGQKVKLAHSGSTFRVGPASLKAWSGWWRIIQIDQWGVFFIGAILGMALPAILYTSALPAGTDMRGLAVAAEQAAAMAAQGGALLTFVIALMGAWVLFKTQLEIIEGTVRAITDILWTGSTRIREWQDGDVRFVYYSVMGIGVFWGIVALSLTQPIILLQLGANMAGVVFVVSAVHVLRVNTTLLPPELRPPMWRRWRCCFCACSTASSCICGSWEESSPIPRKAPCSTSLLTWACDELHREGHASPRGMFGCVRAVPVHTGFNVYSARCGSCKAPVFSNHYPSSPDASLLRNPGGSP